MCKLGLTEFGENVLLWLASVVCIILVGLGCARFLMLPIIPIDSGIFKAWAIVSGTGFICYLGYGLLHMISNMFYCKGK